MNGENMKNVEFKFAHDLVESNGKTARENNLEKIHTIPLKTFVEINCDYDTSHGCRGYVVDHQRDCDGTPLYGIAFDPAIADELPDYRKGTSRIVRLGLMQLENQINKGWSEDSLIIIHKDKVDE